MDNQLPKSDQYSSLLTQIPALIEPDLPLYSNLANITAALHHTFHWWWTGFYLVHQDMLVLGPFQGPVACTRIAQGKGVCGTAWAEARTLVVPDVHLFPGHIACSAESQSEIVLPIMVDGRVVAVLDVDSEHKATFDDTDAQYLEQVCAILAPLFR